MGPKMGFKSRYCMLSPWLVHALAASFTQPLLCCSVYRLVLGMYIDILLLCLWLIGSQRNVGGKAVRLPAVPREKMFRQEAMPTHFSFSVVINKLESSIYIFPLLHAT